jgi:hypothetical protein
MAQLITSSAEAISAFYPTATPSIKNAAESTKLAKALVSQQSSWDNSDKWTSVASAITAVAPSSALASFSSSGFDYQAITAASWYSKVNSNARSAFEAEQTALDKVASKVLDGGAKETQRAGLAMVGAAGIVGIMAAL